MLVPVAGSSFYTASGAVSATVGPMTGKRYMFTCDAAVFIKQAPSASSPTASAANGSTLVPPNVIIYIDPKYGDTLAVIQDAAAGKCTLSEVAEVG